MTQLDNEAWKIKRLEIATLVLAGTASADYEWTSFEKQAKYSLDAAEALMRVNNSLPVDMNLREVS